MSMVEIFTFLHGNLWVIFFGVDGHHEVIFSTIWSDSIYCVSVVAHWAEELWNPGLDLDQG